MVKHKNDGGKMDTNGDPFEKNRKLIESLISPERWDASKWRLSQVLFYSNAVRGEYIGPLNDDQQHLLKIVNYHAEILQESLDDITLVFRLLFSQNQIELNNVDVLDGITVLENELTKEKYVNSELQINKAIPNGAFLIQGDSHLISVAFKYLGRLIKQIAPNHKGNISIGIRSENGSLKVFVTRDKFDFTYESGLTVYPFDVNPEWFIVHTIIELHGGKFMVDDSNKDKCTFYLELPLQQSQN